MITFKEYMNEGFSKTEQELLDRSRGEKFIYINGKQEHDAANKLVAKGHAKKYDDVSYWSGGGVKGGEYYINPFTRKQGLTKGKKIYGGTLHFHEPLKESNDVDNITSDFVNHYKNDPVGAFMHAKSSYLDAVSRAKNFSMKAANLHKAHSSMSKQEFQDTVMKHFGSHLKKHGFPKHASEGWGKAEQDMMKDLV